MQVMIKVSVIVPVYNVEPYLKRCMDCLINQSLKDIEVICIDDFSTDNSLTILKEYSAKSSIFKIIELEKNQGAAVARNIGLEISTGEYLAFVDPDDAIDLNYFEDLYKKAKETNADIVKCQMKLISKNGNITEGCVSEKVKKFGLYAFTSEWQTALYKHSLLTDNYIKFVPSIIKSQDSVFLNDVLLCANSIELIDTVSYYYYKRDGSLNSKKILLKNIYSAICAKSLILENINKSNLYDNDFKNYIYLYNFHITAYLEKYYQNDTEEAHVFCIKKFIESYDNCKYKQALDKNFKYKNLLPLIKKHMILDIVKVLNRYTSYREFQFYNEYKFLEQIFSVKKYKDLDNTFKVLCLLGLKFCLNSENKGQNLQR